MFDIEFEFQTANQPPTPEGVSQCATEQYTTLADVVACFVRSSEIIIDLSLFRIRLLTTANVSDLPGKGSSIRIEVFVKIFSY